MNTRATTAMMSSYILHVCYRKTATRSIYKQLYRIGLQLIRKLADSLTTVRGGKVFCKQELAGTLGERLVADSGSWALANIRMHAFWGMTIT